MKKVFTFFMIFMAIAFISNTNAQTCTPDHPGYTVVPDAGILLPTTLPNATVGVPYTASITIGVPGTAQTYPVNWIQYKSSTNFISTNTWTVVDSVNLGVFPKWPKLTWHCGIIKGTPATAGTDSIRIFVDANVTVFGFPFTQANVKAFTLPLIVDVNTGIDNNPALTTKLLAGRPNPFNNSTKIGIMAERTEKATLNVYSILGQMVYSEAKTITAGENFFDFTGTDLSNGTYIYTVITSEKMFNEKLIKTK